MSCWFVTRGTGSLYKIDGIVEKQNDMEIRKQHLKILARKLGQKRAF